MALGFLIAKFFGLKKQNGVYVWGNNGLSLGEYIFVKKNASEIYIMHEKGHTKQSYILGWLYLFVIGIPSIVWNVFFEKYRKKNKVDYYDFYTEKWADKLAGIERR
jgi:hypothetical protein